MPRYARAIWRPLSRNVDGALAAHDAVILHTDAGDARSLYGWFETGKYPSGAPCADSSHFYVAKDGSVEQYADTSRRTRTSGAANRRSIGVETQGLGTEPWTKPQAEAIAQLLAWCHKTHGIPLRAMTSSRTGEKGVGWHRLGIDGNFPSLPNALAGRGQRGGGEVWSKSRGKACPGDDRIQQVPGIIARAQALAGAQDASAPTSSSKPAPATKPTGTTDAVRAWQEALEVAADGSWGPATDARSLLMAVTARAGRPVSRDTRTVQGVVDVAQDGQWGPRSRAGLTAWIKQAQKVLGVTQDGSWGPRTDKAYAALRRAHSKV